MNPFYYLPRLVSYKCGQGFLGFKNNPENHVPADQAPLFIKQDNTPETFKEILEKWQPLGNSHGDNLNTLAFFIALFVHFAQVLIAIFLIAKFYSFIPWLLLLLLIKFSPTIKKFYNFSKNKPV